MNRSRHDTTFDASTEYRSTEVLHGGIKSKSLKAIADHKEVGRSEKHSVGSAGDLNDGGWTGQNLMSRDSTGRSMRYIMSDQSSF
jgi:hypothetical protein